MKSNRIKVIYITNQACFHDIGFIDVFFEQYKNIFDFIYLTTEKEWDEQRKRMGYSTIDREYIVCSKNLDDLELANLFSDVDTLCIGSNNDPRIKKFYKKCKNVVFCTEHLSKNNALRNLLSSCKYFYNVYHYFGKKPQYLLSYSYHGIEDYKRFGFNRNNLFLFGYFPKLCFSTRKEICLKDKYKVLWCGRLVDFKRVERALFAIKYLHKINSKYELTIIGDGPHKNKILSFIKKNKADYITVLPFQDHESILKIMKESGLFLFTSDRGEGWGVVLNEAMSQGCICICSSQAGSTNTLEIDGETGLIFKNRHQFEKKLKHYDEINEEKRISMSLKAVDRMKMWSNEEAGTRFGLFLLAINKSEKPIAYPDGPISYKRV